MANVQSSNEAKCPPTTTEADDYLSAWRTLTDDELEALYAEHAEGGAS